MVSRLAVRALLEDAREISLRDAPVVDRRLHPGRSLRVDPIDHGLQREPLERLGQELLESLAERGRLQGDHVGAPAEERIELNCTPEPGLLRWLRQQHDLRCGPRAVQVARRGELLRARRDDEKGAAVETTYESACSPFVTNCFSPFRSNDGPSSRSSVPGR